MRAAHEEGQRAADCRHFVAETLDVVPADPSGAGQIGERRVGGLPVMAIGGHAVHVPYHITWDLERVDHHDEDVTELSSTADVPLWLGIISF